MAKLFSSLFRRTRHRITPDLRDPSTYKLYKAACRLLRDQDHEQMSVAQLTKAANVSVGAFYRRFRDKDAFLRLVLAEHFYGSRNYMERVLSHARWEGQRRCRSDKVPDTGSVWGRSRAASFRPDHVRPERVTRRPGSCYSCANALPSRTMFDWPELAVSADLALLRRCGETFHCRPSSVMTVTVFLL